MNSKQQITVEFIDYSAIHLTCDNQNTAQEVAKHLSEKNIKVNIVEYTTVVVQSPVDDVQKILEELGFTFDAQYPRNQFKYCRKNGGIA